MNRAKSKGRARLSNSMLNSLMCVCADNTLESFDPQPARVGEFIEGLGLGKKDLSLIFLSLILALGHQVPVNYLIVSLLVT